METHVKVLGVLHIVMGAIGIAVASICLIVFGGVAGIVGSSGDPNAGTAAPIVGLVGMVIVGCLIVLSLPGIVVGYGIFQRRPWGRIGGIVLSIFDLIMFPFGTIVGIYGLWVLMSKETEPLFASPVAATPVS